MYANLLAGLVDSVGTLLGNGEHYSKCPGMLPNYIVDCVPIYMYNKPCVGINTNGKLLPPCVGDSIHGGRKRSDSNKNTNTNTNEITNNIVIKITDGRSVEVENPDGVQ